MSLDRDKLRDSFRAVVDPTYPLHAFPATQADAVEAWTEIYDSYALAAEDVSGDSVVTANRAGFKAALTMDIHSGDPETLAAEFAAAFLAYWTGAVFAIGKLPATPTVPCPSVGGNLIWGSEATSVVSAVVSENLRQTLVTEFGKQTIDGEAKAEALADLFHDATTRDVQVLITGLDTAVPTLITTTCTVF